MILIRAKPHAIVKKAKEHLKSAIMNLLIARNLIERVRREKVDRVLIQTAIVGMPIPTRAIADMYVRAGLNYTSKALKLIIKLNNVIKSKSQPYTLLIHDKLEDVIEILKNISMSEEFTSKDIDNIVARIEDAMVKLEEVEGIIGNYSNLPYNE